MLKQLVVCSVLVLASVTAWAEATLVGDKSSIRFVSVKNLAAAEVHHFTSLEGTLSDKGRAEITIPLASVETMIPIRNERMREMLFEVASFPAAKIEADVDIAQVRKLNNGEYSRMEVVAELDLHGQTELLKATVQVARLGSEVHVSTLEPLVINTGSFDLTAGVEKLREVAGLANIATAVPVMFHLVFVYQDTAW